MSDGDPESTAVPVPAKAVRVAVAVIVDAAGEQVLLSKRPVHVHQGDLWEFPGGKVEPGEMVTEALARELREELGIELVSSDLLMDITHQYVDRSVLLHVFRVTRFTGCPQSNEGQPLLWVAIGELQRFPLPAANVDIVARLQADHDRRL